MKIKVKYSGLSEVNEKLKEYSLKLYRKDIVRHDSSDPDDYCEIDFTIENDDGVVAEVWGNDPAKDIEVQCEHPYECVEFSRDDVQGECLLCGARCDYHWIDEVVDEGYEEDGKYFARTGKVREITEWHMPDKVGGLIGKYLEELKDQW